MDILPIPEINYIASASMDASLCLWNLDTLKGVRKLEGHKKEFIAWNIIAHQT